ncbi:hypothetical protein [Xenorhabdus siamensis]|uniref:hypothetical protein n=1 Tax=Xenorhabdus siamensis TaxID=3136254 RepID=UPI0030F450F7
MSLSRNIFLARKAINYVNIKIGITSPNQLPTQTVEQKKLSNELNKQLYSIRMSTHARLNEVSNNRQTYDHNRKHIFLTSAAAIEYRLGNCGEKAIVAFSYLKMQGVEPLDLFDVDIDDLGKDGHTIVVIGRLQGNTKEPDTWNREAVICDPWSNCAYPSYCYDQNIPFDGELILRYRHGRDIPQYRFCNLL